MSEEDVSQLSWDEKCEILRSNPVTAARQFNYRVDKFFSVFLKSSSNPLGKLNDYFIRIEFQARGSPHAHALLWVQDSPRINVQSDQEVCDYVDRYVTCAARPDDQELTRKLHVQRHSHSSACRRGRDKDCRFDFPQLPTPETVIARTPEEVELLAMLLERAAKCKTAVKHALEQNSDQDLTLETLLDTLQISPDYYMNAIKTKKIGTKVVMKRDVADIWTNNYNGDVLKAWRGNMDLQFVTDAFACVMYIVSYACKGEQSMGDLLKGVVKETADVQLRDQMKKVAATFLNHQEVSAQEAAYRLLSLYLKKTSRKVIYVDSNCKEDRVVMCKPYSEIVNKDDDDADLFLMSVHDKYSARPDSLESICLAEFATTYRSLGTGSKVDIDHFHEDADNDDEDFSSEAGSVIILQNNLGFLCKRQQSAILRTHRYRLDKEEDKHYYSKLLLYLPWRNEDADIRDNSCQSYAEFYELNREVIKSNEEKFSISESDVDNALDAIQAGGVEDLWDNVVPAAIQEDTECNDYTNDRGEDVECHIEKDDLTANAQLIMNNKKAANCAEYSIDKQPAEMTDTEYNRLMGSLNCEQAQIVAFVQDWCKKTVARDNKSMTGRSRVAPFYRFVSGSGGVGKSHVIKAVYQTCKKLLKPLHMEDPDAPTVLVVGPTGVSAFNIGGMTIHSTFLLGTHGYQSLSRKSRICYTTDLNICACLLLMRCPW